ncbi:MAG: DsrE family protein [Campylobacteraceae bacterium]|jgi:intracellular sulfur oxidation DsrE/DsrF family protein|nr:DsrE family protein [Campylobacteraceae bacterium]MBT3883092.1 DsrE family protein [Campylobacteraceae bacterium]MBT4178751.1 DsrE family protein [Campylobacteraceae bacterium]MBT4572723.1 DsrE family protein [Campylobacteraceae bacterium]MBT4708145.1 DsrE family protein [Campylobacteraceae bacterium]
MKKLILLISMALFLNAQDGVKKLVLDLTTSKIKNIERKVLSGTVKHKNYYESKLEELEVAIVIHGGAYRYFIKDLSKTPYKDEVNTIKVQSDLYTRLKALNELYDVEFYMCASGLKKLNIDPSNIVDFVKLSPTSTIALIDKQDEGYAYIPISD